MRSLPDLPLEVISSKLRACVTDKAKCALASTRHLIDLLGVEEGAIAGLSCGAHNLDKVHSDIGKLEGCKGKCIVFLYARHCECHAHKLHMAFYVHGLWCTQRSWPSQSQ
jgi:hypothetical protein